MGNSTNPRQMSNVLFKYSISSTSEEQDPWYTNGLMLGSWFEEVRQAALSTRLCSRSNKEVRRVAMPKESQEKVKTQKGRLSLSIYVNH